MRLIRLSLKNFRQHADTELEFRSGLTGIIGPNGAGKTTVLEAIAWAIYGADAVRGTKDTLRFNRAPGRSTVRAELEFELRGERLRVARTPQKAELYRVEHGEPIAAGITEVTSQLTRRLGMTRREFFNTYFTSQKQLQFLAAMTPLDRARFLAQVLGYERLRAAQELVREERKVLRGQVEELQRAVRDPEEMKRAREEAEERLRAASGALAEAERRQTAAAERLTALEPGWSALQAARERDRQLEGELRIAAAGLERALKDKGGAEAELAQLGAAAEELAKLRGAIAPLSGLRGVDEELRRLAEVESRRGALQKQLAEQRERVAAHSRRIAEQEERGRAAGELREEVAALETRLAESEARRDEALGGWQRERQDVEARLRMLREQAEELKKRIAELEQAGPGGKCPTCKRPLGAEYEGVLGVVRGQYEETVQDGKWHKKRLEQLQVEPDGVVAAREEFGRARQDAERRRAELAQAEAALAQAESLKAELAREEARARTLAGEIAALPEGYDAERHARVREELRRLDELERQATQLETRLERQPALRAARAEAEEEERQIRAQMAEFEARRRELDFSEAKHRAAGEEYEAARGALDAAREDLARGRGEADGARQAAEAARRAEREQRAMVESIAQREREHRLHNELDGALGELRDELNQRVRPELAEIASVFLTDLTDGRYNRIEIDDSYEVVVLDDGEEKPVLAGGEEDLANLVLRLAISQMIADRAGQPLNLLIFDEVFGGLDEQHRERVVRLLQRLQDRFEQVILITHIESIREGMDQVLRVTYDERSGTSVVRDESPGAGEAELGVEDLVALAGD
jgi:exonuclease SbcC